MEQLYDRITQVVCRNSAAIIIRHPPPPSPPTLVESLGNTSYAVNSQRIFWKLFLLTKTKTILLISNHVQTANKFIMSFIMPLFIIHIQAILNHYSLIHINRFIYFISFEDCCTQENALLQYVIDMIYWSKLIGLLAITHFAQSYSKLNTVPTSSSNTGLKYCC